MQKDGNLLDGESLRSSATGCALYHAYFWYERILNVEYGNYFIEFIIFLIHNLQYLP